MTRLAAVGGGSMQRQTDVAVRPLASDLLLACSDYVALDRAMLNFHVGKMMRCRAGITYDLPSGSYCFLAKSLPRRMFATLHLSRLARSKGAHGNECSLTRLCHEDFVEGSGSRPAALRVILTTAGALVPKVNFRAVCKCGTFASRHRAAEIPVIAISASIACMRRLATASLMTVATQPVLGDQAPIIHGIDAKCTLSRVQGEPMGCSSKLVMMTLPDARRTIFLMTLRRANGSSITLSFIGGRDDQPTLNDYTLYVDKVRVDADGKATNYDATGFCKEKVNNEGTFSQATQCMARAKNGLLFELTLGPGAVR